MTKTKTKSATKAGVKEAAKHKRAPYPVRRFQVLSRDPGALGMFYKRAFGWEVVAPNAMAYRELQTGGLPGGIWPIGPTDGHPLTQLFVEVPDVSKAIADVVSAGGSELIPTQQLPDGDEMAVILDIQGLPIGLVRSRRRVGARR